MAIADNADRPGILPAGVLLGGLGILAFSFSLPMNKLAVAGIDAYTVTALRAAFAGLLALVYLWMRRPSMPGRHDVVLLVCSGMGVVVGFPLFSSLALERIDSATTAVINGLLPALTATFAALVGRERSTPAVLAGDRRRSCRPDRVPARRPVRRVSGVSRSIGGTCGWCWPRSAADSVTPRWFGRQADRWGAEHLVVSGVVVAAVDPGRDRRDADRVTVSLTASVIAGMVYLTVISQFLGFFAWYGGLARGGIARIGQLQQIQPLLTIVWSALLLGERLDAWIYLVGTHPGPARLDRAAGATADHRTIVRATYVRSRPLQPARMQAGGAKSRTHP